MIKILVYLLGFLGGIEILHALIITLNINIILAIFLGFLFGFYYTHIFLELFND